MSLGDMNQGITHFIWTENPFWPSYGKGVWVGLIVSRFSNYYNTVHGNFY